jgi:hypothetical protein
MRLIGTMMVSDRTRQKQRGGFRSTNFQAYKIEIHQGGMRESPARDIAPSDPEAHIGRNGSLDAIPGRVLELLKRHRIDPPTMAEILEVPHSMLERREELLDRLDSPTLDRLAHLFCVRREWLVGQGECPTQDERQWYTQTICLVHHLLNLHKEGLKPEIYFLKPVRMDADKDMEEEKSTHRVGITIVRNHATPSGRIFRTFEPWGWEPWQHMQSRIDFLSLVMIFDRLFAHKLLTDMKHAGMEDNSFWRGLKEIRYRAANLDDDKIARYHNCRLLLKELIDDRPAVWGSAWHPQEFTRRVSVKSEVKPEIAFIEERYMAILKALAVDVRRSPLG